MAEDSQHSRLGDISTRETEFRHAHSDDLDRRVHAQDAVIRRYQKAVQRYLLGALRDPEGAAEVFQQFADEFLSGRLRGWDPARGRLRQYLRSVLIRLINDFKKEGRAPTI